MNKLFATIATLVFTGSVHAASDSQVYHGWASGNPDLSSDVERLDRSTWLAEAGMGRGSVSSIYRGFEIGNPDL